MSSILVVGAGGIGCELLKNLALLEPHLIKYIYILDLDTIDISNLNRQFLFRKEHVNEGKAVIAGAAVNKINPLIKVETEIGNIKSQSAEFLKKFDAVLSALDNIEARKYLNRICLLANKPLLEAGSAGYIGQTSVIIQGKTECYECQKKQTPKSFPVCTIRSTPSTSIHCIAWAKMLYDVLYGPPDENSMLKDLRRNCEGRELLKSLFVEEIEKQQELEELWKDGFRKKPRVIDMISVTERKSPKKGTPHANKVSDQGVLTVEQLLPAFIAVVDAIKSERADLIGQLTFTKDDPLAVKFVSVCANLRMWNYWIPCISQFEIESIAGSIIPAIATTNAIVAGLQCANLVKLLKFTSAYKTKDVWVQYPKPSSSGYILQPSNHSLPNPNCYACSTEFVKIYIKDDFSTVTLKSLVQSEIIDKLGLKEPTLFSGKGTVIYDPFDDEEESSPEMTLKEWDLEPGVILQVEGEGYSKQVVLLADEGEGEEGETGERKSPRAKKLRIS
jgi:ubiquitin-like 1-activating enzyme E1 B